MEHATHAEKNQHQFGPSVRATHPSERNCKAGWPHGIWPNPLAFGQVPIGSGYEKGNRMNLLIAIPLTCVVLLVGICSLCHKPMRQALDEIQQEDAK